MQWWLLPFWSKEQRIKYSTFNARVESIVTSSSFREPFKHRRCLVPVRGFFEWQDLPGGKQPWFFHDAKGELLAFAGIWGRWHKEDVTVESCAIIVGDPDQTVAAVHDRQPFVIARENQAAWLSRDVTDPDDILKLLKRPERNEIACYRVGRAVGNVRNQGPDLIEPEERRDLG